MNTRKNIVWNALGSTFNAFNSLIFVIIATRINGVEEAGIFSYAFANACIFYVIGSYIIRAFQVTDISNSFFDSDYIHNRIITCCAMLIAIIGFCFLKGYDYYKSSIIILLGAFKCAEAFAEVYYGILQKNNRLYKVGKSLFVKAVLEAVAFLVIDYLTRNLVLSCLAIVVIYIVFTLFYDIPNHKKLTVTRSEFSLKRNIDLFKKGFFTFLITILGIYLINCPRYAIDDLLGNLEQTVYGIIILPATFMCLLGQYIIQPCLTTISECVKEKDYLRLRKTIVGILLVMLLLGVAVIIIAYFLEAPVLSFVYGVDLKPYKFEMMTIIVGSVLYGIEIIASYILVSFRKTFIQAIVFSAISVIAAVLSYKLVSSVGLFGASITYLVIMVSLSLSFMICLAVYMHKFNMEWKKSL